LDLQALVRAMLRKDPAARISIDALRGQQIMGGESRSHRQHHRGAPSSAPAATSAATVAVSDSEDPHGNAMAVVEEMTNLTNSFCSPPLSFQPAESAAALAAAAVARGRPALPNAPEHGHESNMNPRSRCGSLMEGLLPRAMRKPADIHSDDDGAMADHSSSSTAVVSPTTALPMAISSTQTDDALLASRTPPTTRRGTLPAHPSPTMSTLAMPSPVNTTTSHVASSRGLLPHHRRDTMEGGELHNAAALPTATSSHEASGSYDDEDEADMAILQNVSGSSRSSGSSSRQLSPSNRGRSARRLRGGGGGSTSSSAAIGSSSTAHFVLPASPKASRSNASGGGHLSTADQEDDTPFDVSDKHLHEAFRIMLPVASHPLSMLLAGSNNNSTIHQTSAPGVPSSHHYHPPAAHPVVVGSSSMAMIWGSGIPLSSLPGSHAPSLGGSPQLSSYGAPAFF
jgi:hypothetical protein